MARTSRRRSSGGQLQITDSKGRELTLTSSSSGGLTDLVGSSTTVEASDDKRVQYQEDLDGLMSQIDQLAKDSSYNGVNLLDSDDLVVQFNENGTSKLKIAGTDAAIRRVSASTLSRSTPMPTSMPP